MVIEILDLPKPVAFLPILLLGLRFFKLDRAPETLLLPPIQVLESFLLLLFSPFFVLDLLVQLLLQFLLLVSGALFLQTIVLTPTAGQDAHREMIWSCGGAGAVGPWKDAVGEDGRWAIRWDDVGGVEGGGGSCGRGLVDGMVGVLPEAGVVIGGRDLGRWGSMGSGKKNKARRWAARRT